jgi:tetratricopeptide (TPR) repeat protein
VFCKGIAEIFDGFAPSGHNASQFSFFSPRIKTDERSNAMIGYTLRMLLSNGTILAETGAPTERLAEALSSWQPLSPSSPSTMEYLAATSFCSQSQLSSIERPSFDTVDTKTLQGLLLSRRKLYEEAEEILNSNILDIHLQYGRASMQLGIVTAELANCYNILRQEGLAEYCVKKTLQSRLDPSLSSRCDGIYLRFALADSFIGRARYNKAIPILQNIIDNSTISAPFRMMSALRLAKSRRRIHEEAQKAFEQNSPLWTGLTLLRHIPGVLIMEYVEELACNISEIPHTQLGHTKKTEELITAVNSLLSNSSSFTASISWGWYTKIQQEYLRQREEMTKPGTGTSPSSEATTPVSIPDNEGPWSERLVLSFGMSLSLLIQPYLTLINLFRCWRSSCSV